MNTRWKLLVGFCALMLLIITSVLLAQQPILLQDPSTPANRVAVLSNGAAGSNILDWDGTALGAPSAYGTSPGAVNVPGVNAFITNVPAFTISPSATSTYATLAFDLAATAATNVKSSAGNVYGFQGFNPNATTCYLQFYNSASAMLGTSPLHPFGVVAGGSFIAQPGTFGDFNFSTAISTGQTTTATGSTPCSSAMTVTILYE